MKNLHLKNLKNDFTKTLPINQKYLNKVFSTPNLSYHDFNKTFILHNNFNNIYTKDNFLNDLYKMYKLNITNYQELTCKLAIYNKDYTNNITYFSHEEFSNIIIRIYTEDQIIKELYNENEQKLFYNYINKLKEIRDKKFPHIKSINLILINDQIIIQHHLSTILNYLKDDLTDEEIVKALPQNLPIVNMSFDDRKNIIKNIISNKPNFKLQESSTIDKQIREDSYHLLNLLRKFQLIKHKKREEIEN